MQIHGASLAPLRLLAVAREPDLEVALEDQVILEALMMMEMADLVIKMAGAVMAEADLTDAAGRMDRPGEDLPQAAAAAEEDPRQDPLVPQPEEAGGVGEEEEILTRTVCCSSASRS